MQFGPRSYNHRRDALLGVALLLFCSLGWFHMIPVHASGHGEHVIVAQIGLIMIALLAALMTALTLFGIAVEAASAEENDPFLNTALGAEPAGLWILAAIWGGYIFSMYWIGFYAGGAAALVSTFLLVGLRSPLKIAAIVLAALVLVYAVFDLGFHLDLPKGRLFHGFLS